MLRQRFPVSRRLALDGIWVAAGQMASAVAALVSIRIMTELLTPDEFGRLTLLVGVAALALGLAANPRLQALIRYYPDAVREGRTASLRQTAVRLIIPLVAIAVCVLVTGWLAAGPRFGDVWFTGILVSALLVVDCLRSLELSLFNAARRQREAALIYAADAWSRPLMAVAAVVLLGSNANAALAGYVGGSFLVLAVMRLTMRLEGTGRDSQETESRSDGARLLDYPALIRRYALPLAPLAIFGWLSGMGDRYVIAGMLSIQDAGLYAAAYGIASRPFLMLGSMIELTMRPVLQNAITANDRVLIQRVKRNFLLLVALGAGCGVVCFAVLSDLAADLFLATEYHTAASLMPLIALGYALYIVSNVFSRFCYAFDDTHAAMILTITGAVIGIAVMVPAIHWAALWGAGSAVPVRFGVELALSSLFSRRAERRFFAHSASRNVEHQ